MTSRPEANDDNHESWVRPPARPIRYGPFQRWSDRRNGRIDGKKAVPRLPPAEPETPTDDAPKTSGPEQRTTPVEPVLPPSPAPISTFYVDALCRRFDAVAAEEKRERDVRLVPLARRLGTAVARAGVAAKRLKAAEADLERVSQPPTEDELADRHVAEEAFDRPAYLTRQRRLAQFGRTSARGEARYAAIDGEWHACDAEVADLRNRISTERRLTNSRVRAQLAHTQRRIATYWTHLIRTHERGAELNESLRPAQPRLPDWTRDDTDGDEEHP